MFSERDQTNLLFRKLIEKDDSYDPKITFLKEIMRTAEHEIMSDSRYRRDVRQSPTFEQLAEEWEFMDSLVEMSGKIYIKDGDFAAFLPEEWGEAHSDAYGTWFNVPKTQFVSVGPYPIEDTSTSGGEDDQSEVPFRLGYGMILPQDMDATSREDPVGFYALPEDVTTDFLRPSFTAIDYRLHDRYPDILAKIDAAVPIGSANITRCIHRLRELLPTVTIDTPEEVIWLSEYIWNRLGTDRQWPYIALFDKRIVLEAANDEPEEIILHEPIEQCAYITGIVLTQSEDIAGLGGALTFALASGTDAETEIEGRLFAPFEAVQSVRSLRPRRSLVEQIKAARLEKLRPYIHKKIGEAAFSMAEYEYTELDTEQVEKLPYLHRETLYERLSYQNEVLQEIITLVTKAHRHIYDDESSAASDCRALVEQIAEKFTEAGLYGATLSVSGETVLRPNIQYATKDSGIEFRFPSDQQFVNGMEFTDYLGSLRAIIPRLEAIDGANDAPRRYRVDPMILLEDDNGVILNNGNDVAMFSASITRRSLASIADGCTNLIYPEFEALRQRFAIMDQLRQRRDPKLLELVQELSRIERAFYHETSDGFTKLRHTEKLRKVAEIITATEMDDMALNAFSKLFVNRQTLTIGGIESTAEGEAEAMVTGEFVGIVSDYPYTDRERLAFVLQQGATQRYLPIDEIQTFLF